MHTINFSDIQPYLFCISGLIFIFFAIFKNARAENLSIGSERAEGTIHELQSTTNLSGNTIEHDSIAEDRIVVKFVTRHKEWITAPLENQRGVVNPNKFKPRDKVDIIYNTGNPTDFIIETKRSEKTARIFIAVVGVLFLVTGLLQILMK